MAPNKDMKDNFVIDPLIGKRQQLLLATQLCRLVLKVRVCSLNLLFQTNCGFAGELCHYSWRRGERILVVSPSISGMIGDVIAYGQRQNEVIHSPETRDNSILVGLDVI